MKMETVSEIPKDLIDFVKEHGGKKSTHYTLSRHNLSRVYQQTIESWKQSTADMASVIHRAACHNLKSEKLSEASFRITIRTDGNKCSKHFLLRREISTKDRCEDCKGSGWYVGIVERRPCPTCDGTGRTS
jgi:DnaJ-class molecular chaperone